MITNLSAAGCILLGILQQLHQSSLAVFRRTLILFRLLYPTHFPESGNVGEKDAEIDGVSGDADHAKVIEDEVKDIGEPESATISHDGSR